MKTYGHFDEHANYVITDPRTPEPWLHYMVRVNRPGTETFCSGVTLASGGFDVRGTHENTFIDTRLHLNDADDMGRYLYVVDKTAGTFFSTTWQPIRHPDQHITTTFGFGTTVFESECKGIRTIETMFVPPDFDGWIKDIVLRNESKETRVLCLYPFVPIHMGNALVRLIAGDNDGFFGGASFDKSLRAIVFRRNHGTAVEDDPTKINGMLGNVAAFYSTLNTEATPYETSLERLFGDRFHNQSNPRSIIEGTLSSRDQAHLRQACGAFKNEVTLAPGQEIRFAVALVAGSTADYYLNGKQQLGKWLAMIDDPAQRTRMRDEVAAYWKNSMGLLRIATPEPKVDRAFKWLQYQCRIVYILNRMKSRFHTGYEYGWGFRDILQDVLFNLPYDPETVAKALLHISTQMFATGTSYHNFFIDQPGNKAVEASDDPLWFPNAVIKYCKETADFAFLDRVTDYADVYEGKPGVSGTILEHCQRGVDRVWQDRSTRGLPFLKDCDWNDDLNELRRNGRANDQVESVMVAQQLYRVLLDMAELFTASGRQKELAASYRARASELKTAIERHAIDAQGYYKRALSVTGQLEDLGSSKNAAARVFLEPQVFGVLSGVADTARAARVMEAVERDLDTDFGAMLCYPFFTDLADRCRLPQRSWNIEKEPPGMKENGSIFMHLNAWLVQAYCTLGRGKSAVAHYVKTLPESLSENQDRYRCEPFIYPEYVRGKGIEAFGRGGHTWLTGTAPTMHQALIENIFGVRADYDGLEIDPCVAPDWKQFSIEHRFRGATYAIRVANPNGVEHGVKRITVDGQPIDGRRIPPHGDSKTHVVEVLMG